MKSLIKRNEKQPAFGIVRYLILAVLMLQMSSCEKSIEPEFPDYLLSDEAIFENASTVNAAMANIYAGLRDNSPVSGSTDGMNVILGLYADELDYYRADSPIDYAFYNHAVLPDNGAIASFWNNSYALIYSVNAIVEGLETSPLSESEKEHFLGEAYFSRAYLHFYLTQLFGSIPYIKTTDHSINATVSRMPLETVYSDVEQDLITARSLLPEMDSSGERLRASPGVATAMLARFYIHTKQWDKAFSESDNLITSGMYTWQPQLQDVFLKESPSTIWQLKPEFAGAATKEGEVFIFDFGPPYLYALTENFMQGFETGDLRKDIWVRGITDGTETWFHPYKYKQGMFAGNSSEYSILFRLAEQYLIRAEAAMQLGNLQEAKEDIDIIRLRAGLSPTTDSSLEDLRSELMRQRKYELFTEQGNRWFDLKRMEVASQTLGPIKTGWKSTDVLFPLPQKELLLNPNLNPQNPGY